MPRRAIKPRATDPTSVGDATHGLPQAFIEAALKAGQGGVVRIVKLNDGSWEIHNPSLVDLETAATHLSCSVRTVRRKAKDHGVEISYEVGARIKLREFVEKIGGAAAA